MKVVSINRVLLLMLLCITLCIVFVTAAVMTRGERAAYWRKAEPTPEVDDTEADEFAVLGEMRLRCKDAPLVLSVWFTRSVEDRPFCEELDAKNRKLRAVVASYFLSYTQKELLAAGEGKVKEDLLSLINSELVLGKIDRLYFNQYIFMQ